MKCLNSWIYKDYFIWLYPKGYVVEDTNGEFYSTMEEAKQVIDKKRDG
ncbi:hypothetical protein [Brevibacillus gelatini]|nr:hypothetical protein [Brevibacillus gelatini]